MLDENSIYAFLTAIFFASLGIFAKYIYRYENIDANITFLCSLLFSTIILFFVLFLKYKNFSFLKKISKKNLILIFASTSFIGLFLPNLLSLKSLQYIDAGVQKVLLYSNPIFIILINYIFLKKKLLKNDFYSILLMIIGLYLIIGEINKTHNAILGITIAIFSALSIAFYSVIEENINVEKIDCLIYWFYSFLFTTIIMAVYMLFCGINFNKLVYVFVNPALLSWLIATAIFSFILPYIFFLKSIETIGATKTGIISSTSPVIAIVFSVILFHENLSWMQALGVILIVTSSILSSKK